MSASDPRCADEAALILRRGGLVIYPTDTVYGLGALASDDEAVRRLFQAKGRAADKPLPLLLADVADVDQVAAAVPPKARALMERFWPGALTIVLHKSPRFHSLAVTGATVAVRVPDHPLLREIIRRAAGPITGTSANRSGLASPADLDQALRQLGQAVDIAIDDGPSRGTVESTVIDITGERPKILRAGMLSREEIEETLGVRLLSGAQRGTGR